MKIAVLGYSGSGKSTLSRRISRLYRCPVLHLDKIQFQPGWKVRELTQAREMVEEFMNNDEWIIDGNYSKFLYERRLNEADLIIFMDFNRFSCLVRAWKRYIHYKGRTRESITQGCTEKMDAWFIKWILWEGRNRQKKKNYREMIHTYRDKTVVIRNQKELDKYWFKLKQGI